MFPAFGSHYQVS